MIEMLVCRLFRFNHRLTAIKKAVVTTSTDTLIPRYQDCPEHVTDSDLSLDCIKGVFLVCGKLKKSIIYTTSTRKAHEHEM